MLTLRPALLASLAGAALALPAHAQAPATPPSRPVFIGQDSGFVSAPAALRDVSTPSRAQVVYSTLVQVENAAWLRLAFSDIHLSGVVENGNPAFIRITSLQDGGVQTLTAEQLRQWSDHTAFFNGDSVYVELLAHPGAGVNRVRIATAEAGIEPTSPMDSICGPNDDRALSSDDRMARHSVGCTSWLFNDTNIQFLTAGHCTTSGTSVMSFKVPLSTATGTIVNPPPAEQYPVDATSNQGVNGGIGNDWRYFGVFPNSQTGLMPIQAYNAGFFTIAAAPALAAGQIIRITGYGTTSSPVTPTWNQVQKTHTGARTGVTSGIANQTLEYFPDTTGGNSGSPVVWDNAPAGNDRIAIGIHTHAGCVNPQGANGNRGTLLFNVVAAMSAINNPLGVCRSGFTTSTFTSPLYAAGDAVNNVGQLNQTTGQFRKVGFGAPWMQGLTYDWNAGVFYAVNLNPSTQQQRLFSINPATGAPTQLAILSGAAAPVVGLGFDPAGAGTLYGVIQSTGTIVRINRATGAVTALPTANGGQIGSLEFNPRNNTLYGLDDNGGTRLLTFNTTTGAATVVGALSAGIGDCNGLAVTDDGQLWTINANTEALFRIDPATGAGTQVGIGQGLFGAGFGMAAVLTRPATGCYANCDGSTAAPTLNALDFACFLNRYVAGESYANCDGSTAAPVLNALDFSCFLGRFNAGCP